MRKLAGDQFALFFGNLQIAHVGASAVPANRERLLQLELDRSPSGTGRNDVVADILCDKAHRSRGNAAKVLVEPGDAVRFAHFPCGPSLVSFRVLLKDGRAVEVALIGREGAVGGTISQGRRPAYARAEIQFPGPILRMELAELEKPRRDP